MKGGVRQAHLFAMHAVREGTYEFFKCRIERKFRIDAFRDCLRHIQQAQPRWWGTEKPRWLSEFYLVATGMSDMLNLSYADIIDLLSHKKHVVQKTMQHNVKLCRALCRRWGEAWIPLGQRGDWDRAVRDGDLPQWLNLVRFWIDSTDVHIANIGGHRTAKSNDWSGKDQCPARRFMCVEDGKGVIRKIWRGYSPKRHDSTFVLEHRDFFEDNLRGTAILADEHFGKAGRILRDPRIISTPRENATVESGRAIGFATTQNELDQRRREVQTFRARVEAPFGAIKATFRCLSDSANYPWMENFEQLDNTVMWAVGVHNYKKLVAPRDEE